ncbi:MAG: universal stress protein [Sinobacteraceae bacterium]|nr:universal stress protein [Nevskiaceae bacterium]
MRSLTSILVVANRSDADRLLLAKALRLSQCAGAPIHLFYCDDQLPRALTHENSNESAEHSWSSCVADHLKYLQRLRDDIRTAEVQISIDATCGSPLYGAILTKAHEVRADLIMKKPSGTHPIRRLSFEGNDWQLLHRCQTNLMLVHSQSWQLAPRFAALVDFADAGASRFADSIMQVAQQLILGCRGQLEMIYSEPSEDRELVELRARELAALCERCKLENRGTHILKGDPHAKLATFLGQQAYDAVVMGATTHRWGLAAALNPLTSRLVDALRCDMILVPQPEQVHARAASRGELAEAARDLPESEAGRL